MKLLGNRLFNEKNELLKKLLNESFGFDYVWPENKNQAIYDFYALSLIDPWHMDLGSTHDDPIVVRGTKQIINKNDPKYHDYIDLTDLRYSLMRAKVKNAAEMKKFMTEAIRRAVICEMTHFNHFVGSYIDDFLKKVSNKAAYEKMATIFHDIGYSNKNHEARYDAFMQHPIKVSDEELFSVSVQAFDPIYWNGGNSFGGKNWQDVAQGGLDLINSPDLPDEKSETLYNYKNNDILKETSNAIDHAVDLAHNNGTIFTKWPSAKVSQSTLETKRYIPNIKAFIHSHGVSDQPPTLVSDSIKDAITYFSRYEILTKKDLRYTKKDKRGNEITYDLYSHERVEDTVYDKLTDDEQAQAIRKILTEIGIHDTPDAMAAMTVEVKKVLQNINLNTQDPKDALAAKTKEWKQIFNETLTKLEKSFGVDKINTHNRTLIIKHLDDISRGVKTRKAPSLVVGGTTLKTDYREKLYKLMDLPWVYSGKESLDSLIARYKITGKNRLTAEDYDYLEEWLKNHYKDDYQEFEIFTNNFIPDFEKLSGTKMTPKQVEYIDHLIEKTKGKGYSRRMTKQGQPKLEL
jgi:hypothetical protein